MVYYFYMQKKVVFIIAQKDFRDEELFGPKQLFEARGVLVTIAAKTRHKASSRMGVVIQPQLAVPEVEAKDFDGIIFVGGPGAAAYLDDTDVKKIAWEFKKAGKLIGASCFAPAILANAGVLISKTVTGFPTQEQNLRDKGADYTGMPVEVDGNIITAKDLNFLKEFSKTFIFHLEA